MGKSIKAFAPATVANLGCGFDIMGLAIAEPGDVVEAEINDSGIVRIVAITGDGGKLSSDADKNTCAVAINALLKATGSKAGFDITLHKSMPLGSGLGSSAASAAAGVFAANELLGRPFTKKELVRFAMEGERVACGSAHADNVAPSLLGGIVLIQSYDPLNVVEIPVPADLFVTVVHPDVELLTSDSRAVLPAEISVKNAIRQWANVGGLISGFYDKNYERIGASVSDFVAEPYRKKLIPCFDEVKSAAMNAGALACSISGSGPSVFAFSKGKSIATIVAEAMKAAFKNGGISSTVYVSKVDREGAMVCPDPSTVYHSTVGQKKKYSFKEAVLKGLPSDNGLFMPDGIPVLDAEFFRKLNSFSLPELAVQIIDPYTRAIVPRHMLEYICEEAFTFPVPLQRLDDSTTVAELYHGPTLAFKDFGARFMARTMSWLNRGARKQLTILVATSGDTGGAVADAFHNVEGVRVVILYPSGGVSDLQERQLTTYGGNISAIEIEGTFDDCQRLVKTAFLDINLSRELKLSSANSINIARLLPQMIYYFDAYRQSGHEEVSFVVPSGNFGNLTAGLFAWKMGLPVTHFIAATNSNRVFPDYLSNGVYKPASSVATLSNAMDVGDPSNFRRMAELMSFDEMKRMISSVPVSDQETGEMIKEVLRTNNYLVDPHTSVGLVAWNRFRGGLKNGIILSTAHPAKFKDVVEKITGGEIHLPEQLQKLLVREKKKTKLAADFGILREYLLEMFTDIIY